MTQRSRVYEARREKSQKNYWKCTPFTFNETSLPIRIYPLAIAFQKVIVMNIGFEDGHRICHYVTFLQDNGFVAKILA